MALTVTECFLVVWDIIMRICCTGSHAEPGRWRSIYLWWYNSCLVVFSNQHTAELCVWIWEWSFFPIYSFVSFGRKNTLQNQHSFLYIRAFKRIDNCRKESSCVLTGSCLERCALKCNCQSTDGTAACLRVERHGSLHTFHCFTPLHLSLPPEDQNL